MRRQRRLIRAIQGESSVASFNARIQETRQEYQQKNKDLKTKHDKTKNVERSKRKVN